MLVFEISLPHDVLLIRVELGRVSVSIGKVNMLDVGVTTSVVGVSRELVFASDVDVENTGVLRAIVYMLKLLCAILHIGL